MYARTNSSTFPVFAILPRAAQCVTTHCVTIRRVNALLAPCATRLRVGARPGRANLSKADLYSLSKARMRMYPLPYRKLSVHTHKRKVRKLTPSARVTAAHILLAIQPAFMMLARPAEASGRDKGVPAAFARVAALRAAYPPPIEE